MNVVLLYHITKESSVPDCLITISYISKEDEGLTSLLENILMDLGEEDQSDHSKFSSYS